MKRKELMSKLRESNEEELRNRIKELQQEIIKQKAMVASGSRVENPAKLKEMRKEIARIKTILRERGLAE